MARDDRDDRVLEPSPSPLSGDELDRRWIREVERRWQRVEGGEDPTIPWEEAEKYIFASVVPRRPSGP